MLTLPSIKVLFLFSFPPPSLPFFYFFLSSSLWSLAKHLVVPLSNPEYKELIANSLEVLTKCCHGLASHPGNIRILSPVHANFIFKNWDAFYQMRHLAQISTPLLSRSNPSPILKLALYCLQISLANWSKPPVTNSSKLQCFGGSGCRKTVVLSLGSIHPQTFEFVGW